MEDHEIDKLIASKFAFQEDAISLARKIVLMQDWDDKEKINTLKQMAKDLLPTRWVNQEF